MVVLRLGNTDDVRIGRRANLEMDRGTSKTQTDVPNQRAISQVFESPCVI